MSIAPTLVWFRQDLRLHDNAALAAAIERGGPVVPVFILDDAGEGRWPAGGATRWWLHHALVALDEALRARGSRLLVARGGSSEVLQELLRGTGANAVYWNRRYEPAAIARDKSIKSELSAGGIEAKSFNSSLLFEPHTIANKQGKPFQVFTPFWRHCLTQPMAPVVALPAGQLKPLSTWPASLPMKALGLLPAIPWDHGFYDVWAPGEEGARKRLNLFLSGAVDGYSEGRDIPGRDGTSLLSPYLHFGELGPRQIWSAAQSLSKGSGVFPSSAGAQKFLAEVGWREFAYHLLFHFPHTPELPLRPEFANFPWAEDGDGAKLRAWRQGRTGYPIVDAGMRQLWQTGWVHNRVRMVAGSFLVKHLRLPWQAGAAWFWDTLVDADLASNTLGWQWVSGCGADASPYFRIFAPVLQGEKFDPAGDYVRRFVPELARVPSEWIHKPWEAPPSVLARAGVSLGDNYPRPVVDHQQARADALAALQSMRS